jgi:hypothetical protein
LFAGRTSRSLEAKFAKIRKDTMKFQAHVINIQKLNESGTNETDVITKALDAYRRTHEKKHNFGFMHRWPIVKDHPRFFDMERIATPKLGKRKSRLEDIPSTSSRLFEARFEPTTIANESPLPSAPTHGGFLDRPMGSKQAKKTKADENLREYTLRRIAAAATNLSSDLAYRNKIAKEQNDRLAYQTTLNLFEFAQKTNPSLASKYRDAYVELHIQEELLRVQQRMASQIRQQRGIPQQPVPPPPPPWTHIGSLIQQRDEEEGEEDEEDEEDEEGGDDEAYEYASENLLYHGMHDEETNLDLNK